ncbi:uncharacterized protein LOC131611919 isoform X2 [Vicia villosa]|uniref:uncharacterized protein LOC131611919 isoform X2 n=1 Tax=Vicia villosa TaxID=3911 RepID=UPI00273BE3C5|nr:uncharacterized protein LOC131611919 isoform X2 [Vicia villosa]
MEAEAKMGTASRRDRIRVRFADPQPVHPRTYGEATHESTTQQPPVVLHSTKAVSDPEPPSTASACRHPPGCYTAQLASTQGRGQGRGRRMRVPVDVGDGISSSRSRSRLARVSSSRHREEEEEEQEEEVPVPYHEPEGVPDVDPPSGEEDEQEDSYPGGPFDTSVLISYRDHVARVSGRERREIL